MDLVNDAPVALPKKGSRKGKVARRIAAVVAVLVVMLLCFLSYIGLFNGNIRTVVPGEAYRSAQLGPERLDQLIKEHRIKSVVSLRGGDPDDNWFRNEQSVCDKNGAKLTAIRLTATSYPDPKELRKVLEVFDSAPKPLLFHCRGGADRTGLAATLYLHLYEGRTLAEARREGLTWHYGHFPFEAIAMDHLMDTLQKEIGPNGSRDDVRAWILNRYPELHREWKAAKKGQTASSVLPMLGD